jgi:putative secretion ATPase (PEP-CTERM system associated)
MYERFYNLRERPFALSPDPEYLYLSRVHREALDSIRYGIESRAGFIVITGAIGAGKTTLLQTVLRRLDDRTVVARLVNTTLDPRELLEAILIEFGVDTTGKSKPALLRDLGQFLVRQRTEGRRPLLVVDEAQNLSAAALEEIRLLSNLETEKSKLLQILLAGQPNLRDTIASPELEQFRQRVAVSYHLTPLDAQETTAYINSRLERAATGVPPRFPADAAALVHQRSGGVPRIINVICDAALVFGYAEDRRQIDLDLIRDVVGELEATGILRAAAAGAETTGAPVREVPRAAVAAPAAPASTPFVVVTPVTPVTPAAPAAPALRSDVEDAALARAAHDAAERASALSGREQALVQRERELAEQRRILAEEYRLLRNRRAAAAPAAQATRRVQPAPGVRFRGSRPEGLRGWLRRLLAGVSHRPVEDTRSVHGS